MPDLSGVKRVVSTPAFVPRAPSAPMAAGIPPPVAPKSAKPAKPAPPATSCRGIKRGRPRKVAQLTPATMPAWLLKKKAQEAVEAAEREAAMADVEIVGERDAVQRAADRLSTAEARGEVVLLDEEEEQQVLLEDGAEGQRRRLRRLWKSHQWEAAAVRAMAQQAADAAEEAMTLDELVADAKATARASKRATHRALRRLRHCRA